jgi:ABC-type branched-subunit amino acid transport system substrate-binding protein
MKCTSFVLFAVLAFGATQAVADDAFFVGVDSNLDSPSARNGIELAVAEINAAGGVLGRKFEVLYTDNPCDAASKTPPLAKIALLIGESCTQPHDKLPYLIDNSAAPSLAADADTEPNDWSSQITPPATALADGFIATLKQQGARKIALVGDDDPSSRATADLFAQAIKAAGMDIAAQEFIPLGATDFAPLLVRLMASAPDHVVVSGLDHSATGFFSHYELFNWRIPVAGCFDLAAARDAVTPQFLADGGLQGVASLQIFSAALPTQPVRAFVGEYVERFDSHPDQHGFYAYQAVYLIADALRRAASDSPADILAALRSNTMPAMAGGSLSFDEHHIAHPDAVVTAIRDGRIIVMALLKT